jgi:hypothetical protein
MMANGGCELQKNDWRRCTELLMGKRSKHINLLLPNLQLLKLIFQSLIALDFPLPRSTR